MTETRWEIRIKPDFEYWLCHLYFNGNREATLATRCVAKQYAIEDAISFINRIGSRWPIEIKA